MNKEVNKILSLTLALAMLAPMGTGLKSNFSKGLMDKIGVTTAFATTTATPNGETVAAVWNSIKANPANQASSQEAFARSTPVSSGYVSSYTKNGVTKDFYLMQMRDNYNSGISYMVYTNDYLTPRQYHNGYYGTFYPAGSYQLINGEFNANLVFAKYSWATSEYFRFHMFDLMNGVDSTFEYWDYWRQNQRAINVKTSNADRIIYGTSSVNSASVVNRLDRNTGATISNSSIPFGGSYDFNSTFNNGVMLNDNTYAFVATKGGYNLIILNLDNLAVTKQIALSSYPTLDATSMPGYLLVKQGTGGFALDSTTLVQDATATAVMNAASLVSTAEQTKLQSSLDTARTSVNLCPDGDLKTGLITRLDTLQASINANNQAIVEATALVVTAEQTQATTDISAAQAKVSTLWTTTTDKVNLQNRIYVVQATVAVTLAESTVLQTDVTAAQTLINQAPAGTQKTALQTRLTAVTSKINARTAVVTAETTKTTTNIANARTLVNALPDSSFKTDLSNRLDVASMAMTVQAVVTAETTKLQSDITAATTLVNGLQPSQDKNDLLARLNVVSLQNATASVVNAETVQTESSIITARALVDALATSTDKTALESRIDVVQADVATATDNQAPNAPVVSAQDNLVTITATDKGGLVGANINTTETFDDAIVDFPLTGDWAKSTLQKSSGTTSLKSFAIGSSGITSSQFAFTVPTGATNAKLAFKYLVSSEANYDFLNVYVNGVRVVRASGAGAWTNYSQTLTPGSYTVKFEYTKDGSVNANSDSAFIDDINVAYNGQREYLPSGVKTLEYSVNDGAWSPYSAPFTPSATGDVKIAARATDYAGNVGASTTTTVKIEGVNVLEQAGTQLTTLEGAITNLDTQAAIDSATSLLGQVNTLIATIPDTEPTKAALVDRANVVDSAIDLAQATLNATVAVTGSEATLSDLSSQALIDSSRAALSDARNVVSSLPTGDVKQVLSTRLDVAQSTIDKGQATLDVVGAETASSGDLTSQGAVDAATSAYDTAKSYVGNLPSSTTKTALETRLDSVKVVIDTAKATIEVVKSEQIAVGLTNQGAIDSAKAELTSALALVNALPSGTQKTDLLTRTQAVQLTVDTAQATLETKTVEDLVIAGIQTQSLIDGAKAQLAKASELVNALPSGDSKTALTERIAETQLAINVGQADIDVRATEEKAIGMGVWQATLDAQAAQDIAVAAVNILPDSVTAKADYVTRLAATQLSINEAKATVKTTDAEVAITQEAVTEARTYISALPDGVVKAGLQIRVDYVQSVIDAETQVVSTSVVYGSFENVLLVSDLTTSGAITTLQSNLNTVKTEVAKSKDKLAKIDKTDKEALKNKLANLNATVDTTYGMTVSTDGILTEALNNSRKGNGSSDYRMKIDSGSVTNLLKVYGTDIEAKLHYTTNLKFVSVNTGILEVDKDGNVKAIKNGVGKITVFNSYGLMDIYFVVSGQPTK